MIKFSFIGDPIIFYFIEINKIEGAFEYFRGLAIQFASSVEGIIAPKAIVSRFTKIIVEYSLSTHFIFLKLSFIEGSIVKDQLSFAFFHVVEDSPLVMPSLFVEAFEVCYS
jgi:hypothetical protein